MEVEVSKKIDATPAAVAAIMFDPRRDKDWLEGTRLYDVPHCDWLQVGARVRREGHLVGRNLTWVTEVEEHEPDRLLRLRFVEGPINGGIDYRIEPDGDGSLVTIHNRSHYEFTVAAWMITRSAQDNLDRLAKLVEAAHRPTPVAAAAHAGGDDDDYED